MARDSTETPSVSEEELVAYLDGELDAQAARRVEDLLVGDPRVRSRLQELERTWDLLDELAPADVDDAFTRSTLELVAVSAARDAVGPGRRWRLRLAGVAVLIVAAAAGFLTTRRLSPDPAQPVVEDLPLLEHLDRYRQIDDFGFLLRLHQEELFRAEDSDGL